MARVVLRGVTKRFGDVEAVKGVSLEIADKEFVVLVGPSGCGKSTTLRMVAGLEEVTKGEIFIDDRLVNDVAPKDRDIAMVFQNYALYPHMTVFDNLAFALKLRKVGKREIDQRVRETAQMLEISDLLSRKPKQLSGGQRQRVAVGRAIVRKPKVFLFDEPLSNLDAKLRVQMRSELSKLHHRLQTTIIYVTHDQTEAMTMGDRIVVMKDGLVQQVGAPLDLYNRPDNAFVAGFIGSPAMNFIPARLVRDGEAWCLDAQPIHVQIPEGKVKTYSSLERYAGKEVTLGIRPEDIEDADLTTAESGATVRTMVEVLEPMGSEAYLHCNCGGKTFTARVESRTTAADGVEHDLVFKMDQMQLFDSETGQTIH